MSCNGCRVLRKGCGEGCVLRHSLRCIDSPEAQAHATLFVTKFFGRAGLTGFINGVPENQRPALFQSLLYEACGRTVNPVYGAVGLLFSGKWALCQAAVETVLRGGSPRPLPPARDHVSANPADSLSTVLPAAGLTGTSAAAALMDDVKHIRHPVPPALESSLATSASSLKASSLHAAENNGVLNFSRYSTSSQMIKNSQDFNKRPRECKPESTAAEEDHVLKKARCSFLINGSSAATTAFDPCDKARLTLRPRSIMAWVDGFSKANCREIGSDDCMTNYDAFAPLGRDNLVVLGSDSKNAAPHNGRLVINASKGPAVQGTHHDQQLPVAHVARRIYIPETTKQHQYHGGGVRVVSMSKGSKIYIDNGTEGDHHETKPCMQSCREDCPNSWSFSVNQDAMRPDHPCAVDAVDMKLKLGLLKQAQHGELCHELVNNNNAHEKQKLIVKNEEPMSSPSVNSEGSVNTLVGGLDRSCCTAKLESPKSAIKLLNLLF